MLRPCYVILSLSTARRQEWQCTYNVTLKCVRVSTVAVERAKSITYSEFVSVALVIQHAKRMRHVVIRGLSGFYHIRPHYLINDTMSGKILMNTKCVFWFPLQTLYEIFSFQEELSEIWSKMYIGLRVKNPLNFLSRFSRNIQMSDVVKIRAAVAELPHADGWMDGQTDMTKLKVVLRSFANAPNKIINESSNYIQ